MHLDIFASEIAGTAASQIPRIRCVQYFCHSWKALSSPEIILRIKAFILFNTTHSLLFYHNPLLVRMFKAFSAPLQTHQRPPKFSFLVNGSVKGKQSQLAHQNIPAAFY